MRSLFAKIACLTILFLGSPTAALYAQRNDIKFERISVEQELSQSTVSCILQDHKGFMWFGTWDGLNRYDGYGFTVFRHNPEDPGSLSGSKINALFQGRDRSLWVGTESGLNRLDRRTGKFVRHRHDPDDPESLSFDVVTSVCGDRNGAIWVGTEKGLNRLDSETGQAIRFLNDPGNPRSISHEHISCVYEDRSGVIWVGTKDGLNRLDRQAGKFVRYRNDPANPHSLSHSTISCVYEDRSGELWVGTESGLNRLDPATGRFTRHRARADERGTLSSDKISAIWEDRLGTLWIGTELGLNRFDREKGRFVSYKNDPANPYSLGHNVVWSLFGDSSGVMWVGTYTGGLSKFDLESKKFVTYRSNPDASDSLSHNVVWTIHEDRSGTFWIGTDRGLNRFDPETETFRHYRHDPHDPHSLGDDEVWAIAEDASGILWVGTKSGLDAFDRDTETFTHHRPNRDPGDPDHVSENKIKALCSDRTGILWVGSDNGLNRFDRETGTFVPYGNDPGNPRSLSSDSVWSLYEDASGTLWVGTDNGLNRFDPESQDFVRHMPGPESRGLSDGWVLSLHEDREGVLWVGTLGGLNRFDPKSGRFVHYREKDGLPNDVVYGILEDDEGHLWLSTNKGLAKFHPGAGIFRNYSVKDGLQSNEFNVGAYFRSEKGEMLFGGINGFNLFRPEEIRDNTIAPRVLITDFQIGDESVPGTWDPLLEVPPSVRGEIVRPSYKDRVLAFEFVALHYSFPRKNRYAYMMEGFDEDWIDSGTRRFARYTNLPPGDYVFRVRGANSDGVWNTQGDFLRLSIPTPPWKTWWAYTIYLALSGGALLAYVRHKSKAHARELARHQEELRRKHEIAEYLELKVEERTRELNSTLRKVEEANTKIMDSIQYAQMIQGSLLPNMDEVRTYIPDSFFIWMPRDIVGGDIFFADFFDHAGPEGRERGFVIAVIDCTGHGVPGAFMTMIASSGLRRIVRDEGCRDPAETLRHLNFIVKTSLQQDTEYALSDDGLDAAICFVRLPPAEERGHDRKPTLSFAAAKHSLICVGQGGTRKIKGDKQSIGYKQSRRSDIDFEFTEHTFPVEKGTCFYMYTDGFTDQLGGQKELPFGTRNLIELLEKHAHLPFAEQKEVLIRAFEEHRGDFERQDDVTLVGFSV